MTTRSRLLHCSTACACLFFLSLAGCFAKKAYMKAAEEDTPEAYEQFLEKYPDSKKYSKKASERAEQLEFDEACEANTYAAYMKFLEAYPPGKGKLAREAEMKAEDIRAQDLDITIYRDIPVDYYNVVSDRYLPYRIMVRSFDQAGSTSYELESKWFFDLNRKDLLVPMDPQLSYPVNPNFTLYIRQSVIYLCHFPMSFVQAEMWSDGRKIKGYRLAAPQHIALLLIYALFQDRALYDSVMAIPEQERKSVSARFEELRRSLPLPGTASLEVDIRQDAYPWDREMTLSFAEYLNDLNLYDSFQAYPRGQPPDQVQGLPIYFRVDEEIHSPYVREQWSTLGPTLTWNRWNSKWILSDKDFFFKKMTLDLVDFLYKTRSRPTPPIRRDSSVVVW